MKLKSEEVWALVMEKKLPYKRQRRTQLLITPWSVQSPKIFSGPNSRFPPGQIPVYAPVLIQFSIQPVFLCTPLFSYSVVYYLYSCLRPVLMQCGILPVFLCTPLISCSVVFYLYFRNTKRMIAIRTVPTFWSNKNRIQLNIDQLINSGFLKVIK